MHPSGYLEMGAAMLGLGADDGGMGDVGEDEDGIGIGPGEDGNDILGDDELAMTCCSWCDTNGAAGALNCVGDGYP